MGVSARGGFAAFEAAAERALGARLRSGEAACRAMWPALADVGWRHASGSMVGYTFRDAGQPIAAVRGKGSYILGLRRPPAAALVDQERLAQVKPPRLRRAGPTTGW
jgi:hypothetical protein